MKLTQRQTRYLKRINELGEALNLGFHRTSFMSLVNKGLIDTRYRQSATYYFLTDKGKEVLNAASRD